MKPATVGQSSLTVLQSKLPCARPGTKPRPRPAGVSVCASALMTIEDCGDGDGERHYPCPGILEPPRLDDPLEKDPRPFVLGIAEDPVGRALLVHDAVIEEADLGSHLAGEAHFMCGK